MRRKRSQGCSPLAWVAPRRGRRTPSLALAVLLTRGTPGLQRSGETGCERPLEPASATEAPAVRSLADSGLAASGKGPSGPPPPAARPRLRPAALGPPSELLPAGRGSLPCPRLGSRRSAKSPWRRAISEVWPGSAMIPACRVPPAPLLRVALGTWHSLPPESRAALPAGRSSPRQPAPLRRCKQRHLPRATGKGLRARGRRGRAGRGERGGTYSCSRESRNTVHPASALCYGALGRTRFI